MKFLPAALLITGIADTADAHVLEAHRSLVDQLGHQLLGLHHLAPLLLIVLALGLLARRKKS